MNAETLKSLRVAATSAKYTPLQLRLAAGGDDAEAAISAAVPVRVNAALTGVLLALPPDFLPADVLSSAAAAGSSGSVGPYAVVDVHYRGAGGRELTATTNVLLVDIDVEALEVEGGSLDSLEIGALASVINYGTPGRSAAPAWLSARSLKEAAEEWARTQVEAGEVRADDFLSADEAAPGGDKDGPVVLARSSHDPASRSADAVQQAAVAAALAAV